MQGLISSPNRVDYLCKLRILGFFIFSISRIFFIKFWDPCHDPFLDHIHTLIQIIQPTCVGFLKNAMGPIPILKIMIGGFAFNTYSCWWPPIVVSGPCA